MLASPSIIKFKSALPFPLSLPLLLFHLPSSFHATPFTHHSLSTPAPFTVHLLPSSSLPVLCSPLYHLLVHRLPFFYLYLFLIHHLHLRSHCLIRYKAHT